MWVASWVWSVPGLRALKGILRALYWSGVVFAFTGGLVALGALLGVLGHLWLQGRADARACGEHPGIFCEGAGGTVVRSLIHISEPTRTY